MVLPDPLSMEFVMLGEDSMSTTEKLTHHTGSVSWEYLRPHFEREALYFVDPSLSLEKAGTAFATNQKDLVERWLKSGDLVKIGSVHSMQWDRSAPTFKALVVSPFVLCRPMIE
jgi:hypothetical protein